MKLANKKNIRNRSSSYSAPVSEGRSKSVHSTHYSFPQSLVAYRQCFSLDEDEDFKPPRSLKKKSIFLNDRKSLDKSLIYRDVKNRRPSGIESDKSSAGSTGSSSSDCPESDTDPVTEVTQRTMKKLEELSLEFNQVNSELSKIVAEEHKLLKDVDDQKERFACNVQRLEKLNKEAQSNIKRSFYAYKDYHRAVEEINHVMDMEESKILCKSIELGFGSHCLFTKMPAHAVQKINKSQTKTKK